MKKSMRQLRNIFATAVCSITIYSCQNNKTHADKNAPLQTNALLSYANDTIVMQHFISIDSANKMIQSYLTSVTPSGTTQDSNLYSLILDAETLRGYLSDTSIKNVKVMLAHTLDYINAGNNGVNAGYQSGALTVVIAGYNNAGDYVFGPHEKVPNMAKPCPTYCTIIGTASNSLLQ